MRMGAFLASFAALALVVVVPARAEAPHSGPPPLATYGQLPGFEMAAMSPSGEHVAIIATVEGVRRLIVMDAGLKPVTAVGIGKVKLRGLQWAGDTAVLVHYSATRGLEPDFDEEKAELSAVIVVPLAGKPWEIFSGYHDSITGGVWGTYGVAQRDGRWYGYFGGIPLEISKGYGNELREDGLLRPDLYEVDLQSHQTARIARRPLGETRHWLVDGHGAVAATLKTSWLDGVGKNQAWAIYNAQDARLASGSDQQDGMGWTSLVGLGPDGTSLIYARHTVKGASTRWFIVPLAGGTPQPFLDSEKVEEIIKNSAGQLIGYRTYDASEDSHFLDARRDKVFKAAQRAFPGLQMSLASANDAFDRLLVTTEGPGDPITWWQVDIKTGNADELGHSYAIASADVGPMRMVPFSAADGLKMEGVLTLPPGLQPAGSAKNLPAIVMPHGGPFGV